MATAIGAIQRRVKSLLRVGWTFLLTSTSAKTQADNWHIRTIRVDSIGSNLMLSLRELKDLRNHWYAELFRAQYHKDNEWRSFAKAKVEYYSNLIDRKKSNNR